MREGTLSQLKVKVGDKVRPIRSPHGEVIRGGLVQVISKADHNYGWFEGYTMDENHRDDHKLGGEIIFRLEEEAMKLWKDMSHADKEGLKEAHHRGRTIQFFSHVDREWDDCGAAGPTWIDNYAFRVKPETKEETMKLWKDMTACEKGALLLAYHEGKTIEYHYLTDKNWNEAKKGVRSNLGWIDNYYYRVKHVPVVTEVVRYGHVAVDADYCGGFYYYHVKDYQHTHKITFNLVDGEPDCNSIKMEKL